MKIYKYYIGPSLAVLKFDCYEGAEVLSAGLDGNENMCIWVKVDTATPPASLKVYCIGTGWDMEDVIGSDKVKFVGTVTQKPYVWHVFVKEKE